MEFMNHHDRANRITELKKQIGMKSGQLEAISIDTFEGQRLKNEIAKLIEELTRLQETPGTD